MCGAVENLRGVIVEKRRKVVRECDPSAEDMEQAMTHYTLNIGVDLLERCEKKSVHQAARFL